MDDRLALKNTQQIGGFPKEQISARLGRLECQTFLTIHCQFMEEFQQGIVNIRSIVEDIQRLEKQWQIRGIEPVEQ